MANQVDRNVFLKEIDILRAQQGRVGISEIARLALRAGLPPHSALLAVRNYSEYRSTRSDSANALEIFVSSLCSHDNPQSILEYTTLPILLTAQMAATDAACQFSFVSENHEVSETLQLLFAGRGPSVFESIAKLPPAIIYDSIVCTPPLGFLSPGNKTADGFGGEIVRKLVPHLAQEGTLYWITGRGVVFNPRAHLTLADLKEQGFYSAGCIEIPSGAFPGTIVEAAVVVLRREVPKKRFVAALRDTETTKSTADAFISGPTRKEGPNWSWLDPADARTFSDLERLRLLQKLAPLGQRSVQRLGTVLHTSGVVRANHPISETDEATAFLYIPEYAGSRVTAELDEQTVSPKAVYRLPIDPKKANARFLAQLLNSPYGKQLRENAARGATIQRVSVTSLLDLELPIPDLATQDRIARIQGDISLLQAAVQELQGTLAHDWKAIPEIEQRVDGLKAVLDIERQIAEWWRELPYPLATIYRRYQVSTEAKDRLETLLHFFEMAAVYLATLGTSHVKSLRSDWEGVLAKWLHPTGGAGIERSDFGFWINLATASLKDVSRIASDKELRTRAEEKAGPEMFQLAATIGRLGKAMEAFNQPRSVRNSWKGHGGHMKASDAARLEEELKVSVRSFYEIAAPVFRHLQLVRLGMAEVTDRFYRFQIEKLSGSDPTFQKLQVELDQQMTSNSLAFWMTGARTMCRALPFFRLGVPQQHQERSVYVFNRIEHGGFRWISYQEAAEQEVIEPNDELLAIIELERAPNN